MRRDQLAEQLSAECPTIKASIDSLAKKWLAVVQARLNNGEVRAGFPKVFNDPVWGTIELLP